MNAHTYHIRHGKTSVNTQEDMKRILITIMLLTAAAVAASAQEWQITYKKADELLGTKAETSYLFKGYDGSFVFWDIEEDRFRLNAYTGIFNYGKYRSFLVTVGLYDTSGTIIKSMKITMICPNDDADSAFSYSSRKNRKMVREVVSFLKTSDGYVRIVAPIYGGKLDLDLKVRCLQSE